MLGGGLRQPAGHHVGIADGLDLLEAELLDQAIETREHLIEKSHHLLGLELGGQGREPGDVGKEHRHLVVAVRDGAGLVLQPGGDGRRENIEQQVLDPLLLLLNLVLRPFGRHPGVVTQGGK